MKNPIKYSLTLFLFILGLNSCQKEEVYKTFPPPVWQVEDTKYSVNMTAVVVLPPNMQALYQKNDQIAAFVNDECRGIGQFVDNAFFITIKGLPEEISKVSFKYYNNQNQYMYSTDAFLSFEQDAIFGTIDAPEILTLNIVQ
ncbi:hypothetical protein [Coprobacter tertius]|uniref:Uncharacterized protein n=1 Tax=Coprobacter tertius TaxID=2944915 RepID=A0ABT1MDP3_9BACT|nr:hypothetical protein [Coprobacter tertius]MCP9610486.1 hypothetical protein [Coprobacter tertius]